MGNIPTKNNQEHNVRDLNLQIQKMNKKAQRHSSHEDSYTFKSFDKKTNNSNIYQNRGAIVIKDNPECGQKEHKIYVHGSKKRKDTAKKLRFEPLELTNTMSS